MLHTMDILSLQNIDQLKFKVGLVNTMPMHANYSDNLLHLSHSPVPVPMPSIILSTGSKNAGTTLSMTCNYRLSGAIDTSIQESVEWILAGGIIDISLERISTSGDILTFSPVATSDVGQYACQLTITSLEHYVTVQNPVRSNWKRLTIGSKRDMEANAVSIENNSFQCSPWTRD